jgi:predicted ribosome quality control (RQC) complex YloA/Tae2 family protein
MQMKQQYDIEGMVSKIKALRKDAEELKKIGATIPAVVKNVDRILADIRILEIQIVDAAELK